MLYLTLLKTCLGQEDEIFPLGGNFDAIFVLRKFHCVYFKISTLLQLLTITTGCMVFKYKGKAHLIAILSVWKLSLHFLNHLLYAQLQNDHHNHTHASSFILTGTVVQGSGSFTQREIAPGTGLAFKLSCLVLVECCWAQCAATAIVELAKPTGS